MFSFNVKKVFDNLSVQLHPYKKMDSTITFKPIDSESLNKYLNNIKTINKMDEERRNLELEGIKNTKIFENDKTNNSLEISRYMTKIIDYIPSDKNLIKLWLGGLGFEKINTNQVIDYFENNNFKVKYISRVSPKSCYFYFEPKNHVINDFLDFNKREEGKKINGIYINIEKVYYCDFCNRDGHRESECKYKSKQTVRRDSNRETSPRRYSRSRSPYRRETKRETSSRRYSRSRSPYRRDSRRGTTPPRSISRDSRSSNIRINTEGLSFANYQTVSSIEGNTPRQSYIKYSFDKETISTFVRKYLFYFVRNPNLKQKCFAGFIYMISQKELFEVLGWFNYNCFLLKEILKMPIQPLILGERDTTQTIEEKLLMINGICYTAYLKMKHDYNI